MNPTKFNYVVGFDDFPFEPSHRGNIKIVGVVHSRQRHEGILSSHSVSRFYSPHVELAEFIEANPA